MRPHIILVGFMGTGKSTVAACLADRLGWARVDLDTCIETAEGQSIPAIFAEKGEAYFRQAETDALARELADGDSKIIATGGGAVLAERNRTLMLDNGLVVALTADEQTIIRRVCNDPNRPLLQGNAEQTVPELLARRRTAYDFAHLRIDTSDKTVEQIAEQIIGYYSQPPKQ